MGQMIWDLLYKPKKKKNSDVDFDFLIEQKKSMLRGGNPTATGVAAGSSSKKTLTEERVHDNYKKLSSKDKRSPREEAQYEALKNFMSLLDAIQWGGGKGFQELATVLTNKLSKRVTEADINTQFQALLRRDSFLGPSQQLLDADEIKVVLELRLFFQFLLEGDEMIRTLAKRFSTGPEEVKKGLAVYFQKAQKKDSSKLQISVLKSNVNTLPGPESPFLFALLKDSSGLPVKRVEVLTSIREEVEFFKILSPLPHLRNKKDTEVALLILGLKKGAALDQIKKQYKSLAKQKHPDKLKGKGIPVEFESIATENFTRIQEAYDILMSELKD